ncbi:hypothetical protein INT48_005334 [Thamnidium elegans]|uniref:Uncharacterized protein n=1 Tax=Thamnidium elegans TaxID=101142 RepID=A0A8H7SGL3_9FUNG|nr:hypothetical protein INT48_005334 [Thamnidium elegans]
MGAARYYPMFIHDIYKDDENSSDQDMEIAEMQTKEETMSGFEENIPENTKKALYEAFTN